MNFRSALLLGGRGPRVGQLHAGHHPPDSCRPQKQLWNTQDTLGTFVSPLQGGDSQNFLQKFVRFFVTLGLKILRLLKRKVVFEAYINKG